MLCCGVLCWVGAGDGSWLDYEVELSARSEASGGTVFIGAAAAPKQTRTLTSHTHQPHAHAHRHTQLDSSLRECVCKVRGVAVCPSVRDRTTTTGSHAGVFTDGSLGTNGFWPYYIHSSLKPPVRKTSFSTFLMLFVPSLSCGKQGVAKEHR
jgi:hypothetical protein